MNIVEIKGVVHQFSRYSTIEEIISNVDDEDIITAVNRYNQELAFASLELNEVEVIKPSKTKG